MWVRPVDDARVWPDGDDRRLINLDHYRIVRVTEAGFARAGWAVEAIVETTDRNTVASEIQGRTALLGPCRVRRRRWPSSSGCSRGWPPASPSSTCTAAGGVHAAPRGPPNAGAWGGPREERRGRAPSQRRPGDCRHGRRAASSSVRGRGGPPPDAAPLGEQRRRQARGRRPRRARWDNGHPARPARRLGPEHSHDRRRRRAPGDRPPRSGPPLVRSSRSREVAVLRGETLEEVRCVSSHGRLTRAGEAAAVCARHSGGWGRAGGEADRRTERREKEHGRCGYDRPTTATRGPGATTGA